jgi:hypothetical protein
MRPQPVPCTATGLALSGGGIRSAAVCLGAIQAIAVRGRLDSIDYLSTVSGGGYIGACLSAAMSSRGGGQFPFGTDILDSDAVAHLRNYSNYLMPRGRSGIRNASEAAVIVLRGLLANAIIVLTGIAGVALITFAIVKVVSRLPVLERLGWSAGGKLAFRTLDFLTARFTVALGFALALSTLLVVWAVWRSAVRARSAPSDTRGRVLGTARFLLIAAILSAFAGLQVPLIDFVDAVHRSGLQSSPLWQRLSDAWAGLAALTGVISAVSGRIGRFLEASLRTRRKSTTALRLLTRGAVLIAACVLPVTLWVLYLLLAAALIHGWPVAGWMQLSFVYPLWPGLRTVPPILPIATLVLVTGAGITALLGANGYSLHRFYRDRLSKAFLFDPAVKPEPAPLDFLRLSELRGSNGPYHIINAALNVQASAEANRRGRNADFFIFTPDFIGSDLTLYTSTKQRSGSGFAPTLGFEALDPRLDLATAVAISGAAVSANMGSSTIRVLSPTLALLNIRLGYWLSNPRNVAGSDVTPRNPLNILNNLRDKFYLLAEMLNLHDETSPVVYLSDGGHIENLGIYELLKRGCQTIIAVDAEADPDLAFPSLLKLERYARIDLGVRISLPWEEIAAAARIAEHYNDWPVMPHGPHRGPHCAVGRIYYPDGSIGTLVYFKASVTGDEKDYILDYWRRHPAFPHETTGDQFFGEEQFEMYRALGYHMVDGFLDKKDRFAFCNDGPGAFTDQDTAFAAVDGTIPVW